MQELIALQPEQIPAWLREAFEDSTIHNLTQAPVSDRLSIRGGVWRVIQGGQEVMTSPNRAINVIIVNAAPYIARNYYEGEFDDSKREAPVCWSSDGIQPDARSAKRQSNTCAQCPQNVAGSGKNENSRACRFQQRLAVVLQGDMTHVYALLLPATSIFSDKVAPGLPTGLINYVNFIASKKIPIEAVITQMEFDVNQTAPTIRFKAVGFLTQEQLTQIKQVARSQEAQDAITFMPIVREVAALAAPAPQAAQMPTQAPALQPVSQPALAVQPTGFAFPGPATSAPAAQPNAAPNGGWQQTAAPAPQPSLFAQSDAAGTGAIPGFQPTAEPAKKPRQRRTNTATVEAQAVPEPVVVPASAPAPNQSANQEVMDLIKQWSGGAGA